MSNWTRSASQPTKFAQITLHSILLNVVNKNTELTWFCWLLVCYGLLMDLRLSISDFPFQWHLSDQKAILLIILYQHGFKNVYTFQTSGLLATVPKLGRQIFGTVGNGHKVWYIGTKVAILPFCEWPKCPFLSQRPKLQDVPNSGTFQLRDHRQRSRC